MPPLNGLIDMIMDHDIASMDATTLQVLNEPGINPAMHIVLEKVILSQLRAIF